MQKSENHSYTDYVLQQSYLLELHPLA